MQMTTIFIFVAMVALVSAALEGSQNKVKVIGEQLEEINTLDWKLMNHLIDNEQTICISKKVIVDGKEFNKRYISKLLETLSKINWEEFYQLLNIYQTDVMNQILKAGRKVIVSDMLVRIERMTKVDWANYYKSYAIICTSTAGSKSTRKTPALPKMDEKEKTMLEIMDKIKRKDKIDWENFAPSGSK